MIAKFTDGVLNTLGNGELTQIHIDLGYSQIDEALIATDTDGKYFKYYLTTPDTEGIYQADTVKIALNDSEAVRVKAKADMSVALEAMTYTFADGKVVQVRPQDLGNFNIAIASGVDEEWVLKDNTVRISTVAELTDAMNDGIVQGKAIWANYKAILKTL